VRADSHLGTEKHCDEAIDLGGKLGLALPDLLKIFLNHFALGAALDLVGDPVRSAREAGQGQNRGPERPMGAKVARFQQVTHVFSTKSLPCSSYVSFLSSSG